MGYVITWINSENSIMDIKAVSKLDKARKYAEAKYKNAKAIEIRQIRGNWKNAGEYLLGNKLSNGSVDWKRVPSDSYRPTEGYQHGI
jgi:hypothetical protein